MNEHLKLSHPVFSNRKEKKTWKYFSLAQLYSLGEKVQSHIQSCPDTSRLSQMTMWSLLNYSNLPENYMVCYQRGKNRNSVFRQLAPVESCLITFSSMCFYFVMGDNDGGYYLYHFFPQCLWAPCNSHLFDSWHGTFKSQENWHIGW